MPENLHSLMKNNTKDLIRHTPRSVAKAAGVIESIVKTQIRSFMAFLSKYGRSERGFRADWGTARIKSATARAQRSIYPNSTAEDFKASAIL
jgi:hypothetical protein